MAPASLSWAGPRFRYGRFGVVADLLHRGLEASVATGHVLFWGSHARVNTTIGSVVGMFRAMDFSNRSFDIGQGTRMRSARMKLSLYPGLLPEAIQEPWLNSADLVLVARIRQGYPSFAFYC